jgi:hypothetical protein
MKFLVRSFSVCSFELCGEIAPFRQRSGACEGETFKLG